jgi:hypothetical protein
MTSEQIKSLLDLASSLSTTLQEMDKRREVPDENVHLLNEACEVQDTLASLFEDGGYERIRDRLVYIAEYFNVPVQSTKV